MCCKSCLGNPSWARILVTTNVKAKYVVKSIIDKNRDIPAWTEKTKRNSNPPISPPIASFKEVGSSCSDFNPNLNLSQISLKYDRFSKKMRKKNSVRRPSLARWQMERRGFDANRLN